MLPARMRVLTTPRTMRLDSRRRISLHFQTTAGRHPRPLVSDRCLLVVIAPMSSLVIGHVSVALGRGNYELNYYWTHAGRPISRAGTGLLPAKSHSFSIGLPHEPLGG